MCYEEGGKKTPPWNTPIGMKQEIPKVLLSIKKIYYPDIFDPKSNEKFKKGIEAVKGMTDELDKLDATVALESQNLPLGSQIEMASSLYKERMNAVYACAVLNAKYKIHTRLVKQFKPEGTNIVRKLEQATQKIEAQLTTRGCRNVSKEEGEGSELSVKRSLIRGSIIEYCNYRHYLDYVDFNVRNRLSDVIKTENAMRAARTGKPTESNDRFPSSESIATAIGEIGIRTAGEISHTQRVFDDAFDAYREFEQNYASHILMVLIEDRYLMIREYLRDTMNPIGQVIYKASNAQSKGK